MKRTLLLLLLGIGLSCTTAPVVAGAPKKMKAFKSERELRRYFREIAEKQKRAMDRRRAGEVAGVAESVTVTSSADYQESITNTQHAGVDEGGIVKLHGDHLIMLRRGRLFTVAIGDGELRPVSAIDAFGPDAYADENWYDEMLVSGDTVTVMFAKPPKLVYSTSTPRGV